MKQTRFTEAQIVGILQEADANGVAVRDICSRHGVPVIPPLITHYFPTQIKGVSNKEAGYDCALRLRAVREIPWNSAGTCVLRVGCFRPERSKPQALGITQTKWPGGSLADEAPFQFVEGEYLRAEEYDEFIANPDWFTLTRIYPVLPTTWPPLRAYPSLSTGSRAPIVSPAKEQLWWRCPECAELLNPCLK